MKTAFDLQPGDRLGNQNLIPGRVDIQCRQQLLGESGQSIPPGT